MFKRIKTYLKSSVLLFSPLLPALFLTLLLMRGFELATVPNAQILLLEALWSDLLFFLKLLPILYCCFLAVRFFNRKHDRLSLFIIGSIWLFIYSALLVYFKISGVPLGADMLGYTIRDSMAIVAESLTIDFIFIIIFILPILVFWFLLKLFNTTRLKNALLWVLLLVGTMLHVLSLSAMTSAQRFKTEFSFNATQNKGAFFMESLIAYFSPHTTKEKNEGVKYLDPAFPFLRKENGPDVLSTFFKTDTIKPNLIFIQVEGLGRAFSGPKAYLGSFTPFLDELGVKSLYFENFLSAQGRTFAALPSILGSLPFAETGFSDLKDQMPRFQSLISIAKDNGYQSTYYGGFEMEFDNQGLFMKKAGIGKIVGANDFSKQLTMASPIGYSDRDLFNKVLELMAEDRKPTLSYIQTISMHHPFTIPNEAKYFEMVENRMDELGFNESQKIKRRPYKTILASILYSDEALRFFFDSYAKLPQFNHTIFILTGDHRLPEIPLATKIDRYHVPLIIYSPMLKQHLSIDAISSQLDLVPSIAAFLKKSYQFKVPAKVTWVGTGLDMHQGFRNIHSYPLKQGKTTLHNYVKGLYFLDNGSLFKIGPNLDLEVATNEEVLNNMNADFNLYRFRNEQLIKNKKLMPDSM
jgi:phosphoglycerol transferase MdoB-like AlkP superfamily enzyme